MKKIAMALACMFGIWYIYQVVMCKIAYRRFKQKMDRMYI